MVRSVLNQQCLVKDRCGVSFIRFIQNEKYLLVDDLYIESIHPGIYLKTCM